MNKEIRNLLENQAFIQKLIQLQTKEEIKDYFKDFNYKITDNEIEELRLLFSKLYDEVNKLSDKEKNQLVNMTEEEKNTLKKLTSEQLDKAVGGVSNSTVGAIVGGGFAASSLIGAELDGKKVSSAVKKIWHKCNDWWINSGNGMNIFITPFVEASVLAGAIGSVAVVLAPVAAGSGAGYLIGKKVK